MNPDLPNVLANYIDGRLCAPSAARYLDVFEPATGAVYAHCPDSSAVDVDAAIAAARRAFPAWSATPAAQRATLLNAIADRIEARLDEFAAAESRDSGKPVALARSLDIPRAISNLRFFAAAITQFASEAHAMGSDAINYTLRQPLGVVGVYLAVESAAVSAQLEDRAGTGCRQYRGRETLRNHAVHRRAVRAGVHRCRPAARRA